MQMAGRAKRESSRATLAWDAVSCSDLSGYAVYGATSYAAAFPSGWTQLGAPTAATMNDPLSSEIVAYRIVSLDACGNPSGE